MKELQTFLEVHGKSSHYMFQLKKCSTCDYCTVLQPPRVPDLDDLSFLPDLVPGEDGQYLDFLGVYGQETNDDHRPSATPANPQSEADHVQESKSPGCCVVWRMRQAMLRLQQ